MAPQGTHQPPLQRCVPLSAAAGRVPRSGAAATGAWPDCPQPHNGRGASHHPMGVAPKAARPQAPALPLPSELQLPRAGRWPPTGSAMAAKARRSREAGHACHPQAANSSLQQWG